MEVNWHEVDLEYDMSGPLKVRVNWSDWVPPETLLNHAFNRRNA